MLAGLAFTGLLAGLGLPPVFGTATARAAEAQAAPQRLSVDGVRLGTITLAPGVSRLDVTIDLGGDVPTATYVIAHNPTNQALQRTNDGYWIPWDSKVASLVDNHFAPAGGKLTYKLVAEDLSGAFFPLSFTLAYRVGDEFKYGVIAVLPAR